MKLSLVTITLTFIINVISISAQTPQACNGYAELCSKAYSDVAYATTHNAYSYIRSSIAANQIFDIPTQLRDGIRGLMLDGNTKTNVPGIELCHGQCNFLDAGPAVDVLRNITKFLQNNPNEVLTIFWENIGNHNAMEYQQIYSDSGLLQYAYTQTVNSSWPTLTEMIQSGKRVVNYIDNGYDPNVPWLMREYDFTFEIPFENSDLNAWMCTVDRPKNQPRPMYVLNHFLSGTPSINGIKISLPQPNSANVSNGRNLETHAKTCEQTFKKIPNYVAVDFYEEGSDNVNVFSVVAELNNVTYTPKQLGDGTTVANSTSSTNTSSTSPSTTSHNASTIVLPRLFEPFSLILSIFLFFLCVY